MKRKRAGITADFIKATYVSLLRGVNVGGGNRITKDQLRSAYQDAGFANIRTYLQSGNIVFDASSELNKVDIVTSIGQVLGRYLHNDIKVVVFTTKEWKAVLDHSPFEMNNGKPVSSKRLVDKKLVQTNYISFLCSSDKTAVQQSEICSLMTAYTSSNGGTIPVDSKLPTSTSTSSDSSSIDLVSDKCAVNNTIAYVPVLYIYAANGCIPCVYNNSQVEKVCGISATTRNFDTVCAIMSLCEEHGSSDQV